MWKGHVEGFIEQITRALETSVAAPDFRRMPLLDFCRDVLGVRLWSKQRAICKLIQAVDSEDCPVNREVFVKTGHGIGKTFVLSCAVPWYLLRWGQGTRVLTTAPTYRQVCELLWSEVRVRWGSNQYLRNLGECRETSIRLGPEWAAFGFSTNQPQNFQGIHAPVLRVIIDEANGFPEKIWRSIDSCLTGQNSQLVAIGNALVPEGRFFRGFDTGADRIAAMSVSSRSHPNARAGKELIPGSVTRDWIEQYEAEYSSFPGAAEARIDAEFPVSSAYAMVTLEQWRKGLACESKTFSPVVIGVDVARYGDNKSVAAVQRGQHLEELEAWSRCSIPATAERVAAIYRKYDADFVVVDDDGIGGGVTDLLQEWLIPTIPFRNGLPPTDKTSRCTNNATEAYLCVREGLENDLLSLGVESHTLKTQLITRWYSFNAQGKLKIEPKADYTKRTGLNSPDESDAWAMAVWQVYRSWQDQSFESATSSKLVETF